MSKKFQLTILAVGIIAATTSFAAPAAGSTPRSGKEVVEKVCASCHATGKNGAPRIGDLGAWTQHAKKGLGKLTENAIRGFGKMPAHGGQASLTDLEVSRAVAFMVSAGRSPDPKQPYNSQAATNGEQLVQEHCSSCHFTGKNGAPRVGDPAAWQPRIQKGLEPLVASAIRGHKSMPARAGLPNLSDADLRGAVIYMVVRGATAAGE